MRDPELILSMLSQMAANNDGRLKFIRHMGMSDQEQIKAHHLELLADAGLIEWWENQLPRITNQGYDFIEAVNKNPDSKKVFLDRLNAGIPLLQAVLAALNLLA